VTPRTRSAYARTLGARLLSEANNIKRTPERLAEELGVARDRIAAAVAGELASAEYRALFEAVAARYPIAFGRLWIDPPDTDGGVVVMTRAASEASARVFARPDADGRLAPYYEYRDAAMSRAAPFRPEWLRMLRVVGDLDPDHPDVAYNKGHFLHQTTLFLGPVNFYWQVDGKSHAVALDAGDSNYITPFWPHSFTARDAARPAAIVAVTYSAEVARAQDELERIGPDAAEEVALDLRREGAAHAGLLRRHLAHEAMPEARFVDHCAAQGLDTGRVGELLAGRAVPSGAEIAAMAAVLCVLPRDLMPPTRSHADEVVVQRGAQAERYPYPDAMQPCYEITRLARARHQPALKSFLVRVAPGRDTSAAATRVALHQFLYNPGEVPLRLVTDDGDGARSVALAPGDSAYVAPMVACRFEADRAPGDVYVVRVPGSLQAEAVFELSAMAPRGRGRSAGETTRWF
jgi:methylphosphonate synthase